MIPADPMDFSWTNDADAPEPPTSVTHALTGLSGLAAPLSWDEIGLLLLVGGASISSIF